MSIQRSQLVRGPAIATYNGGTFFTRNDITDRNQAEWKDVLTSMYAAQDKARTDLVIKIPLMLWGAYENLGILFPSYAINPVMGSSIFGNADIPLVLNARNGDLITFTNAAVTKLPDLFLGVDEDMFAAAVEITCLIGNGMNPETPGAYYTIGSQAYNDGAFSRANYKRVRFTGSWTGQAGMTAITPQKGFKTGWTLDAKPLKVDGLGTVDMTLGGFKGAVKFIPVGATMAQITAQSQLNTPLGTLASSNAVDFVMTGSNAGPAVTLKNAFMAEHGFEFGIEPLRNGEIALETVRGFTAGVPQAVATLA